MEALIQRDPEQEICGIAIKVVDAVIAEFRAQLPNDPIVLATSELFSVDHIERGESVRAADVLVVAHQLEAVVGPPPPIVA